MKVPPEFFLLYLPETFTCSTWDILPERNKYKVAAENEQRNLLDQFLNPPLNWKYSSSVMRTSSVLSTGKARKLLTVLG